MDSSPQSDIVDVVVVHEINMETLALEATEKNQEEAAPEEDPINVIVVHDTNMETLALKATEKNQGEAAAAAAEEEDPFDVVVVHDINMETLELEATEKNQEEAAAAAQEDPTDVIVVHDINMETLALEATEKNQEEAAAATAEEDSTHPEIIVISDDESPTEGVEISQPRVNPRRATRPRWTISEDCNLVNLVCVRRFQFIWKWIADEIPRRSGSSCRLRWQKLMDYEDQEINLRWSHLARFLPVTVTRDHVFDHWRRHMMTNRRYRLSAVTASVDHPVIGSNSSGQNVQNNEGIVSPTQSVGPMTTYPILGQGSEEITSGDDNVDGNTSMVSATTSSNPSFVCAIPDLNLPFDPQTDHL